MQGVIDVIIKQRPQTLRKGLKILKRVLFNMEWLNQKSKFSEEDSDELRFSHEGSGPIQVVRLQKKSLAVSAYLTISNLEWPR